MKFPKRINKENKRESKNLAQHMVHEQLKRGSFLPIEEITVKVGTHTLRTKPMSNSGALISIENTVSPRTIKKSYMCMIVGKALKKMGSSSLSHLANEIME